MFYEGNILLRTAVEFKHKEEKKVETVIVRKDFI